MLETVAAYIEQHKLLPERGPLVVAVSGGADSLCLLHLLNQLCGTGRAYPGVQLRVAHLNHQLRGPVSQQDAEAVAQLANAWGLPVTIGSIDVPTLARQEQRGLEDAARTARYRFLREVAQGGRIAVAHHQDDQVETLLLHWLRGGGLASMVGLQPRQQDIVRPLLAVTRADTLAYCRRHQLVPLEDESNSDTRFLRNRIRHELLPMLAGINPAIRETLLRNAEVMQVDAEWIEQQVEVAWSTVVSEEQSDSIQLRRDALLALPLSLQRHLLRRVSACLSGGQSPLELRHFKLIEALLQHPNYYEELTLHLPQQLQMICQGNRVIFKRTPPRRAAPLEGLRVEVFGDLVAGHAEDHDPFDQRRDTGLPGAGGMWVEGPGGGALEGVRGWVSGDLHKGHPQGPHHQDTHPRVPTKPNRASGRETLLPVPGSVIVPGTTWRASAEVITGERLQECVQALSRSDWEAVWHILSPTRYVVYIDGALIGDALRVRTRRPGDRIRLLGMSHEKKVQDVLVDRHVPRTEREQIPLFFASDHCIWLAGVQVDDRVRLSSSTQKIVRLSITAVSDL